LALAVLRIPIDHCLVSPSVAIVDRRVGPPVGSDHLPVFVDFAISGP
jgi:endonuclease/exonuclease/phosphatase (EEP) superfamily protein YafD